MGLIIIIIYIIYVKYLKLIYIIYEMKKFFTNPNINWVCHHLHLDKSKTINREVFDQSLSHMKEKWHLMRDIKKNYTENDMKKRMLESSTYLVKQGCTKMRTFIDVDSYVGLNGLNCALDLKNYWKQFGVELQIGTQLLEGLDNEINIKLFNIASEKVDFIGCLPSRDKNPEKHLDIVFKKAQELNKDVEAHLDQCNLPSEFETEMFCDYVDKYNYNGKARAIHCISLSCHNPIYQEKICKKLKHLDIGVIICPSAAISMTQHSEIKSHIHNSIAPVKLMSDTGVELGLGIDNIEDIFMPYCDGNFEFELRLLAESARIYEPEILENIASNTIGFK